MIDIVLDIKVHLMKDLPHKFILSIDFMLDYKINISLPKMEATFEQIQASFPLSCTLAKFQSIRVKSSKEVIVPPRSILSISIKASFSENLDYYFHP